MSKKRCPSTMQTPAGIPDLKYIGSGYLFSSKEKDILRALAGQTAELAALPIEAEKAKLWKGHNDLKVKHPLVFIDPENGWNECIPQDVIQCCDPLARVWEMLLRKQIYWATVLKDDRPIDRYFDVPYSFSDTGWGLDLAKHGGEGGGSYKVLQTLRNYEEDFPKIHYPKIVIDEHESAVVMDLAHSVFDGIMPVRRKQSWWWTLGMTWDYINMRDLQDFMCDFLWEQDWVHKTMELLTQGVLDKLDFLEENGLLSSNADGTYVASGGFGYTDDLPAPETLEKVTTQDMWGFVDSQETVSVSPDTYGEFIFPYHKRIAERFGLNCYGCCEAYEPRFKYVKQLPRLRRVSVSPWSDWSSAPELLGEKYITSIKPTPAHLAIPNMDEDVVRRDIRNALTLTQGCFVELIMKDNNTLGKKPQHAARWVEIAREEIARL